MFWIVPPPGGEDFCHAGAATKPNPNEPFEFIKRRFDLKNYFFSSTEIRSGTRNSIHWKEYLSAGALTWFYGDALA